MEFLIVSENNKTILQTKMFMHAHFLNVFNISPDFTTIV